MPEPTLDLTKIIFSHRFATCPPIDRTACLESIGLSASRALGVLRQSAYSMEDVDTCNGSLYWAIQAAIMEINDIQTLVDVVLRPSKYQAETPAETLK